MEVLDTAKQSTYFTINEAKHIHFGMVLLYKKSHCLAVLGQLKPTDKTDTVSSHIVLPDTLGLPSPKPYQVSS